MPVSHDAVAALFHSTRICTTFPAFTPVTLPYWQVISVWVTEHYSVIQQPCAVEEAAFGSPSIRTFPPRSTSRLKPQDRNAMMLISASGRNASGMVSFAVE